MTKEMRKNYDLSDQLMEDMYNDIDKCPIVLKDNNDPALYFYKTLLLLVRNQTFFKKKLKA